MNNEQYIYINIIKGKNIDLNRGKQRDNISKCYILSAPCGKAQPRHHVGGICFAVVSTNLLKICLSFPSLLSKTHLTIYIYIQIP